MDDEFERLQLSQTLARAADSTLALIDLQGRIAAAMRPGEYRRVRDTTLRVLHAARLLAIPVVYTEHNPEGLGGTDPQVRQALPPAAFRVPKTHFSACDEPPFANALEIAGRRQLVLCGLEAHVCVLQCALGARALGYRVFVVGDAVCSRAGANKRNALSRLSDQGIVVTNSESLLFEWLGTSTHPAFSELLALIR